MKDFLKAYKLYFKTAYSPGFAVVGIFMMLFNVIAILATGWYFEEKMQIEMAMLAVPAFLHSFVILFFQRYDRMIQNKFFLSIKNAKLYYTIVPTAVVGSVFLIFDILSFVLVLNLFNGEYAGELLIIYSIGSVLITLGQIAENMPKMRTINIIAMLSGMLFILPAICTCMGYNHGFGLPLVVDILVSLGIYIVGGTLIIGIMNLWWNKSGRNLKFKEKPKNIFGI